MVVQGKYEFKVSSGKLWDYLMDVEVLAKITPGVSKLEGLGDDKYKSYSVIKIGPVKSTFTGKLQVVEKNQPRYFQIKMEQLSRIGNAHVTVHMNLEDNGSGMVALAFDGKANLSGVIARTGQRVLSGVANAITREVFSALEKHIEENRETVIPTQSIPEVTTLPFEKVESTEDSQTTEKPESTEPTELTPSNDGSDSIEGEDLVNGTPSPKELTDANEIHESSEPKNSTDSGINTIQ